MSSKNDGGTAFPFDWKDFQPGTGEQVVREQSAGMSLRDWFAGMALQGIKSNPKLLEVCSNVDGMKQQDAIAKMAYIDADAMLAERSK